MNSTVDVLQDDPQWADCSIAEFRAQARLHAWVIDPVIYAEMSWSFSTFEVTAPWVGSLPGAQFTGPQCT
jgi:hypothetical protein